MKYLRLLLLPTLLATLPLTALADPDNDESGHGKRRGHDRREFKEEYWDGNCCPRAALRFLPVRFAMLAQLAAQCQAADAE